MTHYPPFEAPRLKIDHAASHRQALEAVLTAFTAGDHFEKGAGPDGSGTGLYLRHPIPSAIPLLLGDAIHNLRASLDIAACDAVRLRGKSTDKVKFPFAESKEKLEEYLSGDIRRAGPNVTAEIAALRPYKGGNKGLRGLHDLDVLDKHMLILPTLSIPRVSFRVGGAIIENVTMHNVLFLCDASPDQVFDVRAEPVFVFGHHTPFPGQEIVPALASLEALCQDIINRIQKAAETPIP